MGGIWVGFGRIEEEAEDISSPKAGRWRRSIEHLWIAVKRFFCQPATKHSFFLEIIPAQNIP